MYLIIGAMVDQFHMELEYGDYFCDNKSCRCTFFLAGPQAAAAIKKNSSPTNDRVITLENVLAHLEIIKKKNSSTSC